MKQINGSKRWGRWATFLGLVFTLAASLGVLTSSAAAQTPEVEVVVVPSDIVLSAGAASEVVVIARNKAAYPIDELVIRTVTVPGLSVTFAGEEEDGPLASLGARSWRLAIKGDADMLQEAKVPILVDYSWVDEDGGDTKRGIANAILAVKPPTASEIESLVAVAVESAATSLMEYRPMTLYLTVKNQSNLPVQISSIAVSAPQGVRVSSQVSIPVSLAKGERRAFAYELRVDGEIWSGKHLVIFDIAFEQDQTQLAGKVVKTHEIEVGVMGESGILAVLNLAAVGIPAFLALPGFLMVTLLRVLSNKLAPSESTKVHSFLKALPKQSEAEFWLYAITLSILVTLLFRGGSLLRGYGLSDLFEVWFYSIGIALLVYIVLVSGPSTVMQIRKWWATWQERQIAPTKEDEPEDILRKLHNMGSSMILPRVKLDIEDLENVLFFALEKDQEDSPVEWVTSSIIIRSVNDPPKKLQDEYNRGEECELDHFIKYLEKWKKHVEDVSIDWEAGGPRPVYAERIINDPTLGEGPLIQFKPTQ